jgi:hypothetical protein
MKIIRDIRALTLCGGFGAISFVIMWGLGSILLMTTGLPLIGGLFSSIANAFTLIIGVCLVNRIGAATIISLTLGILTVPTLILGPPGIYKIPLTLLLGITFEVLSMAVGYRKKILPILVAITFTISVPIEYFIFRTLGFPAADKLKNILEWVMLIYFFNSLLGSWLGLRFYESKVSKLQIVQSWIATRGENHS